MGQTGAAMGMRLGPGALAAAACVALCTLAVVSEAARTSHRGELASRGARKSRE